MTPARQTMRVTDFDVAVIGGGPAGATAAEHLARQGRSVLLVNREGRIKPCGGAIPPRAIRDFAIPDSQIVARARAARIIAPSGKSVNMPVDGNGYVGMVDRDRFDPWLRERAQRAGAAVRDCQFETLTDNPDGTVTLKLRPRGAAEHVENLGGESVPGESVPGESVPGESVTVRFVIGADGARSQVARQGVSRSREPVSVFAYHEIVDAPDPSPAYDPASCDVIYDGRYSPDFYAWVFPHGQKASIGVGSAHKGFSLRGAIRSLRSATGLDTASTVRTEGAPIPLKPRNVWDNRRNVILAGDAAGCVAPASGEGIYYALLGGQYAAEAVEEALQTGSARALASARRRFMSEHGRVFFALGLLQRFWYASDKRREQFVKLCADPEIQELTWQAYMNKELVRRRKASHLRIFMKDLANLLGLARA
jgi:geranylgeranyl diphosphate/geranylgeranyl-bacteriochlorophyllide a reductase